MEDIKLQVTSVKTKGANDWNFRCNVWIGSEAKAFANMYNVQNVGISFIAIYSSIPSLFITL